MFMGWNALGGDGKLKEGTSAVPFAGATQGMVAGTLVATPNGWRPVEAIAAGDEVMTFDGGMQRVQAVNRTILWAGGEDCPSEFWPMRIPAGLLGNRRELMLLPDDSVMLESDAAEEAFGDPFALVPAKALEDLPGVERIAPKGLVEIVQLSFEEDQVIFVEGSALVLCPTTGLVDPLDIALMAADAIGEPVYKVLSMSDARLLTSCVMYEMNETRGNHAYMAA